MLLRRVGGLSAAVSSRLRRGLSTAAAPCPRWALIFDAPLDRSSAAPRPSLQLLEPPCVSRLLVPFHLVDPRPGPDAGSDTTRRFHGGFVHAVSGDGLLLLDFMDFRGMDPVAARRAFARAGLSADMAPQEPDILRFICNPLSGEMFRLPDAGGTKKAPTMHSHGLLTHSASGHGPPDRYAVAEVRGEIDGGAMTYTMRRFLSQTGEWDKLVGMCPTRGFPLDRGLELDHEILAFAGRLWWVDLSWGVVSFDPFSDRPGFRFTELPRGSQRDPVEMKRGLGRYRRIGVSEGRLRYAEVTREEPFVLSSFALDNDTGCWTLEHRMALSGLWLRGDRQWQQDAPRIAIVDPLNASVMHIAIGNIVFAVDMDKEKVLGCSSSPINEETGGTRGVFFYCKPCLLPPWLESSRIPSAETLSSGKANVKGNTLSDVLVRVDRSKKN